MGFKDSKILFVFKFGLDNFSTIKNFFYRYGLLNTLAKVLETVTLARNANQNKKFLSEAESKFISSQIEYLDSIEIDFPENFRLFKRDLFLVPEDVISAQFRQISELVKNNNLSLSHLVVSNRSRAEYRTSETLVRRKFSNSNENCSFNLASRSFFISTTSQSKILFLICCNERVRTIRLTRSKFCKNFYKNYGALLKEIKGSDFILKDF